MEKLYTIDDIMEIFSISRVTAYRWCKYNIIEFTKIGFKNAPYRFTQAAVDKVIQDNLNKKNTEIQKNT